MKGGTTLTMHSLLGTTVTISLPALGMLTEVGTNGGALLCVPSWLPVVTLLTL